MELKVGEGKASPKAEFRCLRSRNQRTLNLRGNIWETIAQANVRSVVSNAREDGVVRMKIVVRKQDFKQMLEVMRSNKNSYHQPSYLPSTSLSVEQRLNILRRKHLLRANTLKENRRCSWSPALQSIPEEL